MFDGPGGVWTTESAGRRKVGGFASRQSSSKLGHEAVKLPEQAAGPAVLQLKQPGQRLTRPKLNIPVN